MTTRPASPRAFGPAVALNAEGDAPEWVMLIPPGPPVVGRDGRRWTLADPDAVVAATNAESLSKGIDLPFDVEHAQWELAPQGLPAPAVGWIKEVANRDGAIWARVEWNAKGASAIREREYRYVSPVFGFDLASRHVRLIHGAGLVNRPNLDLPALNSEQDRPAMDWTKVLAALGLSADASPDDAIAAIAKLMGDMAEAKCREATADKFVPRAEYETALNRAATAERAVADQVKAAKEAEIAALVDGAIADGRVTPASKDFYLASCRAEGGVELFKAHIAGVPKNPAAGGSGLDGRKPEDGKPGALTSSEVAICRQLGLTTEEFAKARAAEKPAA